MEKFSLLKQQLTIQSFVLYFILLGILLLRGNFTGAYGLTFGTVMAILNLFLLASTLEKSVQMEPQHARFYVTFHYIIRYMLFFIILIIAIKRADMDFFWAVIGLLVPKAVIYGGNFYAIVKHRKKQPQNNN